MTASLDCYSCFVSNYILFDIVDSDTQSIEEFSGIEQPPLLEQIKRILDEYRNDVQIIKVITGLDLSAKIVNVTKNLVFLYNNVTYITNICTIPC